MVRVGRMHFFVQHLAGNGTDTLLLTGGSATSEVYTVGTTDPVGDPNRGAVGEGTLLVTLAFHALPGDSRMLVSDPPQGG